MLGKTLSDKKADIAHSWAIGKISEAKYFKQLCYLDEEGTAQTYDGAGRDTKRWNDYDIELERQHEASLENIAEPIGFVDPIWGGGY